jgi:hypothetical protein
MAAKASKYVIVNFFNTFRNLRLQSSPRGQKYKLGGLYNARKMQNNTNISNFAVYPVL